MSDTLSIKLSDYHLEDEMQRIEQLIIKRVQALKQNFRQNGELVAEIFNNKLEHLDSLERIVLGSSLLNILTPHVFTTINDIQEEYVKKNIGGIFRNNKFYPTVQTILFLSNGFPEINIQNRIAILKKFEKDSEIFKLIDFEINDKSQTILDYQITVRKEVTSILINNKVYSPDKASDFPAKLIKTKMTWNDLVLPYETLENIEEIVNWAKYGNRVLHEFKLARKLKRGYRALFYGPSGTGKTLTASLIGKKVGKDVYRIDSGQIVSKYIGETEKNLELVFEYAEDKNWILFFDEAEAMFSKRTAIRSSNDRYSNQQVAYLLQRIENFPGIIILSSNKKGEMDQAFLRRFQLMIEFQIPSAHERLILWEKGLNEDFEIDKNVDLESIAEAYEITGGILINILRILGINAIKKNSRKLKQEEILECIKKEFGKIGKTFSSI